MPLAATFGAIQAGIKNAFSLSMAATPDLKALTITNALAAAVPSGLFPPVPTPLVPAGFAATQAQLKNAFSLKFAATPDLVATIMAAGIAALCPMVPPAGITALQSQIKNAFSLKQAATPDLVATMITTAIIAYYTSGGVV